MQAYVFVDTRSVYQEQCVGIISRKIPNMRRQKKYVNDGASCNNKFVVELKTRMVETIMEH